MADAPAVQGEAAAQLEVEDPLSLPPHGAEVFMGGIPRGASEEEIREFASEAGEVRESSAQLRSRRSSLRRVPGGTAARRPDTANASSPSLP